MLQKSRPPRVPGTAVFLTSDPDVAPSALLHNLKHNHVLHERNVIVTVNVATTPRVPDDERVSDRAARATTSSGCGSPSATWSSRTCRRRWRSRRKDGLSSRS